MDQQILFEPIPAEKFDLLTREELVAFCKGEQSLRLQMQKEVERLRGLNEELSQRSFVVDNELAVIKNRFFGKSSEKSPKEDGQGDDPRPPKPPKTRILLPSQRYPDAPLIEREVELKDLPSCGCCGSTMKDSGMTEDSEFLTVIPAQYIVVRQKRHKYRCGKCHGDIKTAPQPPRIKPGSAYSDEMMVDVAMSKYCDLIPLERYSAIAGRARLMDLPPQSLIEATHYVADFVKGAYLRLALEIMMERVLSADETPHRMLEGDETSHWYLWGFSTPTTSYFEAHNTRSGDVASNILKQSNCEFLMSDVFSGYAKAAREATKIRLLNGRPEIRNVYCNAHSRRKFKEARLKFREAQFFIDHYKKIYLLNELAKDKPPDEVLALREKMEPYFQAMKERAMADLAGYSSKSSFGKAMGYFLGNYEELTLFLKNPEIPIDNNRQESLLRNPVVGRKTWYGTHSKRGAETMAILFSLVETCKLNKINPREYFKSLVQDLHQGKLPYTPKEFKDLIEKSPNPVG